MNIQGVLDYYNQHKEQLIVSYLALQTIFKAVHDALEANKDKKGFEKWFGIAYSIISYLGIGKRS